MSPRKVEVLAYDPVWLVQFTAAAKELKCLLGDDAVAIHHIGSTAITGMAAKPIIDILVVVKAVKKMDEYNQAFTTLGYSAKGENGIPGRRYFVKGSEEVHSHHVHIFQQGDQNIIRHLAFRDYMAAHLEAAAAYSRLKQSLAQKFETDIDAYMDGKAEFIKEYEQLALEWQRVKDV